MHNASFGYTLIAINKPDSKEEEETMQLRALEWHTNLLRSISYEYAPAIKINLQYLSVKNGPVHCRVIIHIHGSNSIEINNLCTNIKNDLEPLFPTKTYTDLDPYLFKALTDEELIASPLNAANHSEKLVHTLFYRKPVMFDKMGTIGFDKRPRKKAENEQSAIAPFHHVYIKGDEFFKSMFLRYHDVWVDVTLKPYTLTATDNALLKKAIKNAWLIEGNYTKQQQEDYIQFLKSMLTCLQEQYFVSVHLYTKGSRPEQYLKTAIHKYFFGGKGRSGNKTIDTADEAALKKYYAEPLSFVYTHENVIQPFRLPLPSMDEVLGLNIQSFSFQRFPQKLSLEGIRLGKKTTSLGILPVNISQAALARHLYIMGQTGTGKSTLLKTMIKDCISKEIGFTAIDPHGDLYDDIMKLLPSDQFHKVFVVDPTNHEKSMGIDLLEYSEDIPESKSLAINELKRCIMSLYTGSPEAFGPAFETHFLKGLQLIMHDKVKNVMGKLFLNAFCRIYQEEDFRAYLLELCDDERLVNFYLQAERASDEQSLDNYATYVTSKLTRFVDDYYLSKIFEKEHNVDFRKTIDESGILLIRMDKGKIGADNTSLLGQIILSRLFMAGMSRANLKPELRKPYYVFIDEFQNFIRGDVGSALAEMRKYNISLILANQTLGQLDSYTVDSLLGNAGNMLFFRPGINDYEKIRHFLEPEFSREEILKLANFNCIGRVLIDNIPCEPFVFQTET